jgi:ApbE superfamily uncharacterized protein (UPF0280 family)
MGPQATLLPDGRRLHLNHGPIDVILEAWGEADEVQLAYQQAIAAFQNVLQALVDELPLLRQPLPSANARSARSAEQKRVPFSTRAAGGEGRVRGVLPQTPLNPSHGTALTPTLSRKRERGTRSIGFDAIPPTLHGPVARRMLAACWPYRADFITPMAAVAGAVADHLLEALCQGRRLAKVYVNDGGDIAFHLAPGERLTCGLVADLAAPAIDGRLALTADMPVRGLATSGAATKSSGGRSFSLGIADAVTVLARDAAAADAAATIIANAVDLPRHPNVKRTPATDIDPDSDLGHRLVTLTIGELTPPEIDRALAAGVAVAERLRRAGLIHAAVLVLRDRFTLCGEKLRLLRAA